VSRGVTKVQNAPRLRIQSCRRLALVIRHDRGFETALSGNGQLLQFDLLAQRPERDGADDAANARTEPA
jgi:hypothetical protein